MKQKGMEIIRKRKNTPYKYIVSPGIFIGIVILLSAGIAAASACETYVLVNSGDSIQEAIDSICPEGGVVELATGTHNVSATTTMPFRNPGIDITIDVGILIAERSNITIRGQGIDATIVQTYEKPTAIFGVMDSTDIVIQNMKIYGDFTRYDAEAPGINIHGTVNDSIFSDLYIENSNWGNIHFQYRYGSFDNITIKDSTFIYAHGTGLFLSSIANSLTENCTMANAQGAAGFDYNTFCTNNIVRNCTAYGNLGSWGFKLGYSGNNNNTAENCIAYNNKHGYRFAGGKPIGTTTKGCIAYGNTLNGFEITDAYSDQKAYIINCLSYNNGQDGISTYLWHHRTEGNVYISGTTIVNNTRTGIHNELVYDVFDVKNSIITGNGEYGIRNAGEGSITSSHNNIWDNIVDYNGVSADTDDISKDPKFVNPANGDYHLKSTGGRWDCTKWVTDSHEDHSPCIDAGDPEDNCYEPMPNGGILNLGAYGNTEEASLSQGAATGTISGNVTDTNGTAIENATLTDGARFATTNETGGYRIANVPLGNCTVIASADGYGNSSEIVIASLTTTVNFDLHPIGNTASPTTNTTIIPTPDETGWNFVTSVVVTSFRSDNDSAISYTNYSKTSEAGPWTTVDMSTVTGLDAGNVTDISESGFNVTVSDEGTTEIWYHSVDSDSNVEPIKKVTIKIDTTPTAPDSDLIGSWHFDEETVGIAVDSSEQGNNGTIHGNVLRTAGKLGSALQFNGVEGYVDCGNTPSIANITEAITIVAWIYPEEAEADYSYIVDKGFANEGSYVLRLRPNKAYFGLRLDDYRAITSPADSIQNNQWYHIAGTYDKNGDARPRLYVNGVEYAGEAYSKSFGYSATLKIGVPNGGTFNGTIDEVKIYNRALTTEEIKADYEACLEELNTLSGTVTNPCGTDIANATVTLTTRAGAEINTTQTDSTGHYAFADVDAGFYDITATKRSYWSNTNNVTVTAEAPETADIVLCQKGDLNTNSEPADAGDLAMMADATVNATLRDGTYDLDGDGNPADEADLTLLKNVSVGVAELE